MDDELNTTQTASEDEVKKLSTELVGDIKDDPAIKVDDEGDDEPTTKVDDELDAAGSDTEREEIRARRRLERHARKERSKEKVGSLEREVQGLREQLQRNQEVLASLQDNAAGTQIAQMRQVRSQTASALEHFKREHAAAVERGDGAGATQAMENMFKAQSYAAKLDTDLATVTRQAQTQQAPQLDSRLVDNANRFMKKHSWYKGPKSVDPDSKVLGAIDSSLAAEGWDPTTDAYWEELEVRAARYVPHRFTTQQGDKSGYNTPSTTPGAKRPSPVAGSSGSATPGGVKTAGYTLSAERVKAMKDAGVWDDEKRRANMIKRYQEIDKTPA